VGRNGATFFSAMCHKEAFHGIGMLQSLILIDVLSACWDKSSYAQFP
jgi:hypothetical protein